MISRRKLLKDTGVLLTGSALRGSELRAQLADRPPTDSARFVAMAEALKPALRETVQTPLSLVKPVADIAAFLRWRMEPDGSVEGLANRSFKGGDSFIVDFGGHRTGFLSFDLAGRGVSIDSPTRLRITLGEVPGDVAEPFYPYKGTLSEAWLPDAVITVNSLPQHVRLPDRYAFRYVKVEVIATSDHYAAVFSNFQAHAVTAASRTLPSLAPTVPATLRRIDEVSMATLRDCMQTTFEDGPRRDQRLWIGDLRLQALTNYATFQENALVRRCLYLLAAFPRADGLLHGSVFEKPKPAGSGDVLADYAALYVAALADYVKATGDLQTGRELFPVAQRQLAILSQYVNAAGRFVDPGTMWIFIDWREGLDRTAAMHGVLLYSYRSGLELAMLLGHTDVAAKYRERIAQLAAAGRAAFYDESRKVFVSGPGRQVSWASQAWLVLAGVVDEELAKTALLTALGDPASLRPGTPYGYHYVVSALLSCGLKEQASQLLEAYWGAMVRDGADTFWEVFDPTDSRRSPYGDVHVNSFCHAWSCTPSYFLRTPELLGSYFAQA